MSVPRVAALLKERMGLDAQSIGLQAIQRAVRERVRACALPDEEAYWGHLIASEPEMQELIELVVVPETWFFRDREAFTALTRIALLESQKTPGSALRVLSVPCATGEEPFSIAMALLDAGVPDERFWVDGVDISARAVGSAERAIYGKNAFRGTDLGFRDRYFERAGRGYELSTRVRRRVRFRRANLFAPGAFPAAHSYDVIFCRNVLIYFDAAGQQGALQLLARLLTPGGTIFVGPSESGLLLDRGFESIRMPLVFGFRVQAPGGPVATPRPVPAVLPPWVREPVRDTPAPAAKGRGSPVLPPVAPKPVNVTPAYEAPGQEPGMPGASPAGDDWITQARQLADQGKLLEALQVCEVNMEAEAESAQAYCLMGVLHDAAGRTQKSIENYRRALYLDPTHEEALVHLGTALMREGDVQGAQRLFDRAKRARGAG